MKQVSRYQKLLPTMVAPHAGAWIETYRRQGVSLQLLPRSPPTRGRGLKHIVNDFALWRYLVAPHAGAWIETVKRDLRVMCLICRPPRGGVD